jgi:hypothetical protein
MAASENADILFDRGRLAKFYFGVTPVSEFRKFLVRPVSRLHRLRLSLSRLGDLWIGWRE